MKLLTLARDLRRRKARARQRLFAAEGLRSVEELLRSSVRVRGALVTPNIAEAPRGSALLGMLRTAGIEIAEVSEPEFESAAETDSPQGILAIAEIPGRTLDSLTVHEQSRLVVLDGIQDPGNAGTILRTAAALGAAAVVAGPGTVDLWNAKVVRSAMGASFHFPVFAASWEEIDLFRQRNAIALWGADAAGTVLEQLSPPGRLALIVGNEGAGLSAEARQRTEVLVSLPIGSLVESLNVAVATGIFLYQLRQ